jgi:hypothetical protein
LTIIDMLVQAAFVVLALAGVALVSIVARRRR